MNKDLFAYTFALLLVCSICLLAQVELASAQGEIVLDGTDFLSIDTLQYPEGIPAVDSSRIILEYVDFAIAVDIQEPTGLAMSHVSRIITEYADYAVQIDIPPLQDLPNIDASRIIVEYADCTYLFNTCRFIGPQPMGLNDTEPPEIDILTRTPSGQVTSQDEVTVQANVSDWGGGVKNATLQYNLNDGAQWFSVPMTPNTANLENSLSVTFHGVIPRQSNETLVSFRVIAYDYAWNTATKDGEAPYCPYLVIPEFQSSTVLLLLTALSLFAVAVAKRRTKRFCIAS